MLEVFDHLQIRNTRSVEGIRKAIKDSHKDEIAFHSASVGELNQRLELVEKRFEKIYDDKIDGKITEEFYQKKFKQYTKEKDEVNETLNKHSSANTKYYEELAMNIYELSQRAREIYLKAKLTEQKRQLIKLVFAKLVVEGSKLTFTYTKAFELLSEAVKFTNSSKMLKDEKLDDKIFEPQEKLDITGQTEHLYAQRPIWLENRNTNITTSLSHIKYLSVTNSMKRINWK